MSSPSDFSIPPQLARFPVEVRDAYRRYCETRDADALQIVVTAALREHMPKRTNQPTAPDFSDGVRLIEDLGYDSLAVAEIVFFFEDLFQVTIRTQDLQAMTTVGELRAFVLRQLAEKSASA
ncbi:MAG TPA: acyl carrier protein [Opitutaceae bacterium]